MIWEDIAQAIDAGTFQARADLHLSRTPLVVDEQGWGELGDALTGLLREADRIAAGSAERLARSADAGITMRLVVIHFESPR